MLFHLLAAVLVAFTPVTVQAVKCASFWPGASSLSILTPQNAQCYIYKGYPQTIGSRQVTIAYDSFWNNPNNRQTLGQLVDLIQAAATQSIDLYELFQPDFPDLIYILTDEAAGTTLAGTNRPLSTTGPCQTVFFSAWSDMINDDRRRHSVAHETYHCVQGYVFGADFFDSPTTWWIEGTAEYFADAVYPDLNIEAYRSQQYQPDVQIFTDLIPNVYSTYMFFESMGQSIGPWGVHEWVKQQLLTSGPYAERARLSVLGGFGDDFHQFARHYADATILDSANQHLPPGPPVIPTVVQLTTNADGTLGTISIPAVNTFTLNQFKLFLNTGQTVYMSYSSPQKNVRVSYSWDSPISQDTWLDMPANGETLGSNGVIVLQCNGDDSVPITILITSTEDRDDISVEITVEQRAVDPSCVCQSPRSNKRALDHCSAVSATASPTSTISSSATSLDTTTTTLSTTGISASLPSTSASSTISSESVSSTSVSFTTTSVSFSTTSSSASSPPTSPSASSATGCSPNPSLPTIDPCLEVSTWKLDNPAIEALLRKRLSSLQIPATINSLSITGSGTLSITGGNATFTYSDYTIDLDVTAEGIDVPTHTVINGVFEANLYMQASAEFCLDVYSGEGSLVETDPVSGGLTYSLGPGGGFIDERLRIDYVCKSGSLTLQGTLNGVQTWGPFAFQ